MKNLFKKLIYLVTLVMLVTFLVPMAIPASAYTDLPGEPILRAPNVELDRRGNWNPDTWTHQLVDEYPDGPVDDDDYITGVSCTNGKAHILFGKGGTYWPPHTATNITLTIHFRARDNAWALFPGNTMAAAIGVRDASTGEIRVFHGTLHDPPDSDQNFRQYSYTWSTNPLTGEPWTRDTLDAGSTGNRGGLVSFGVYSDDLAPNVRVSAIWAEVRYSSTIPYVNFPLSSWSITESGAWQMSVNLSQASTDTVRVNYSVGTSPNYPSATPGVDYTIRGGTSGTLTFNPDETSKKIIVDVIPDFIHEGDESIYIILSNPVNCLLGARPTSEWIIIDDDPINAVSINDVSVKEGTGGTTTARFTVTLDPASTSATSIYYQTAAGTAASPGDYTQKNGHLNFAAGQTTAYIDISIAPDSLYEPDETFYVNLSQPNGVSISRGQGVGTILDDDTAVEFSGNTYGNEGTDVSIDVVGAQTRPWPITVNYTIDQGNATYGLDYTIDGYTPGVGGSVTIPANSSRATIHIHLLNDNLIEQQEFVQLALTGGTNMTIGFMDIACFFINDTNVNTPPVLTNPGNKTVDVLTPLSFNLVALDSDLPAQTLTYTISSGSQSGMTLNSSSGAFSWTPTAVQGPASYQVTFRVTDSGSPALYDEKTITITVNKPGTPPTVTQSPENVPITYGANATFTSTASGDPAPAVQWQVNTGSGFTNIANGGVYSGATTTTLSLTKPPVSYSGYQYRAVFTNGIGQDAISTVAALTVNKATATVVLSDLTRTYTGSSLYPTATTTPSGLAVVWTGAPQTNAGTYAVTAAIDDANYEGSASGTFVIQKADAVISVTPYQVTYDGNPHTAIGTATGVKGEALTGLDLSGTTHTSAGTYNGDPWTFTDVTGNYNSTSGTVDNSIAQATAVITLDAATLNRIYNGSPVVVTATTTPASLNYSVTYNGLTGVPSFAGSYAVVATISDANYTPASDNGTLIIAKADAIITVNGWSGTYDGQPHGASGTATGVMGEDLSVGLNLGATFTDVPGGIAAWIFHDGTGNYKDRDGSVDISIAQASQVINVTANAPGTATFGDSFTVTATGGDSENPVVITTDGIVCTGGGSGSALISIISGKGSGWVRFNQAGNTNYAAATQVQENVNAQKAAATIILSNLNQIYDGTAKYAGVTTSPSDLTVNITYTRLSSPVTEPINAGSYEVSATINDDNHEGSASGTLIINKANQTISWTTAPPASAIYGTGFDVEAMASSGLEVIYSSDAPLSNAGASYTMNSGTGTGVVKADQPGDDNYNPAPQLTASVAAQKATAEVTLSDLTLTYTGSSLSPTATTTPPGLAVVWTGAPQTSAGTYAVTASIDDANYEGSASGTFVILKADQTIEFGTLAGKTYGDAPFTVSASASSGLPVSFSIVSGPATVAGNTITITGVGEVTVRASQSGNINYNGATDVEQSFTVAKADATVIVTGWSGTYDGQPHGASGTATGVNNEDLSASLNLGATFADVPGGTIYWSFSNPNYNEQNGNVAIVINKANAAIMVTPYQVTYDGNPHTASGTATGVKGEALVGLDLSGTAHTDAGTYDNDPWIFTDVTGNYHNANGTVDNKIDPATPTINVTDGTFTYDGNLHPASAAAAGVGGAAVTGAFSFTYTPPGDSTEPVNAGIYAVVVSFTSSDTNYTNANGSGTITINKADQIITVTSNAPSTAQYSDKFVVSATGGGSGNPVVITTDGIVCTGGSNNSATITMAAGTGSGWIKFNQVGNDNYYPALDVQEFVSAAKEDAGLTFHSANPVSVRVASDGRKNSAFTWQVKVTQANDGYPGDLGLIQPADITLSFSAVGSGGGWSGTASAFDHTTGVATFNIPADVLGVETYTGIVTLDNRWFVATPQEDVLVVYDPSLGFTTGGGWFYWPDDGSALAGVKTNFGFTMKYNKKGTNIQGSFLLIAHLSDGGIIRLKSNAVGGLAIVSNTYPGIASFSGKCVYTRVDAEGNILAESGNQEFTVYVQDMNEPGNGTDMFWFTTKLTIAGEDALSLDSNGNNKVDEGEYVFIGGGNIVVPHTSGSAGDTGGGGGKKK